MIGSEINERLKGDEMRVLAEEQANHIRNLAMEYGQLQFSYGLRIEEISKEVQLKTEAKIRNAREAIVDYLSLLTKFEE